MTFFRLSLSILVAVFVATTIVSPFALAADDSPSSWRQRKSSALKASSGTADVEEEIRFGREVAARIIGRYSLYDNPDLMRYLNLVGKAVAMNTGRPEIEFRFAVLNTDEINAYAAPGGYVFVTRGAILRMQDEAELAAVLGHEIAHVGLKHIVKELNIHGSEDSPISGFARLIGGTSESARLAFAQAVEKALDVLFKDGYKREDEVQADKTGLSYTVLSGYDPAALGRYLERIGPLKEKSTEVLDKTHPSYKERVEWLTQTITEEGMDAAGAKTGKQRFEEIRGTIK